MSMSAKSRRPARGQKTPESALRQALASRYMRLRESQDPTGRLLWKIFFLGPLLLLLASLAAWSYGASWIFLPLALALGLLGQALLLVLPPKVSSYLIFGLLTTLVAQLSFNGVNLLLFGSLEGGGGLSWIWAQTLSWILAVTFAFLSNRHYVFWAQKGAFWPEFGRFVSARLISGLGLEYGGMLLLVNGCHFPEAWSKLALSLLVILVNYILARHFVFQGKGT